MDQVRATIRDVARRAGVSEATVSRALRNLRHVAPGTAEDVRRAADELGFVPSRDAASLATGRARIVSVVTPSLVSWFYASVLDGVDEALRAQGYAVGLIHLGGAEERRRLSERELRASQAAAHVVIGFALDDAEQALLRSIAVPVVTVGGRVDGIPGIGIPEEGAARMAVEHLASLGHRRIGHVGAGREEGLNPAVSVARQDAWAAALAAAGAEQRPEWFGSGAFQLEASRDAAERILALRDRPTAIFAASDISAFGVLVAAQRLGLRVPEDLSVAGIDDHPFAAGFGLTTVRQSPSEQGARAVQLLMHRLGIRRSPVREEPAPIELVVRTSTAPPA